MLEIQNIIRLSRTALVSLIESRARHIDPVENMPEGTRIRTEWHRRFLHIEGQSIPNGLTINFENREGITVGDSFNLKLLRPDKLSGVNITLSEKGFSHIVPAPGKIDTSIAILKSIPKVIWEICRSAKQIYTFLKTRDPATADFLRKAFCITSSSAQAAIIPENLFLEGTKTPLTTKATIVVPIYNAARDVEVLLSQLTQIPYPIIFIDDASTDPSIKTLLLKYSEKKGNTKIIWNKKNFGFVASANKGIAAADGHIILLNSDTIPPKNDWASRLLEPILNDPKISTVTPFSNNAEIISIPAKDSSYIDCNIVETVDGFASKISTEFDTMELPTGIGFCMAMNRKYLDKLGGFDATFGRGYGEEVDWCQKAMSLGGRNVALASVFVGHKGGSSFGDQKSERIRAASKIISTRYPDYDASVQAWVKNAPTQPQFLVLSISWLASVTVEPVPVFIAHSMGGGAETALQDEVREALKTKPGVLILRVGGPSLWRLELKGNGFFHAGDASSMESVAALLAPLKRLNLIYSCGVGGRHPRDAADMLLFLFDHHCTLEMRIHDFFPVSPSWNLLDSTGRFYGVPDIGTDDIAHAVPALNRAAPVSHASWRALWAQVFEIARNITVFSESSQELIGAAYPCAVEKITVRPHRIRKLPNPMRPGGSAIGVLGSLNKAKGAEVIKRLSLSCAHSRKIVVLGEMDGAFALGAPHVFHGRYANDRISELAEKYDIGLWFIPSICPETFSFATHEALATGLPVMAFTRGAQGEAVAAAANGYLIDTDPDDVAAIASLIEQIFQTEQTKPPRQVF